MIDLPIGNFKSNHSLVLLYSTRLYPEQRLQDDFQIEGKRLVLEVVVIAAPGHLRLVPHTAQLGQSRHAGLEEQAGVRLVGGHHLAPYEAQVAPEDRPQQGQPPDSLTSLPQQPDPYLTAIHRPDSMALQAAYKQQERPHRQQYQQR